MLNELQRHIETTAFSFRGYSVTNLGKTSELLAHAVYGPTMERHLHAAGEICAAETGRPVDLVRRVVERSEPGLDHYAEAVALVMGVEFAQIELLQNFFGADFSKSKLAFGYSLGELAALACAGVIDPASAMRVPIALAEDSAALAHNVRLAILFSRGPTIDETDVRRLCRQITSEGLGTISISAILSPNTYLLLGQNETTARFAATMHEALPAPVHLRLNPDRWPPLHTEIARQRHIPDRASVMMESMPGGFVPPCPPILSLVTGKRSYDDLHARDILRQWVDQPQRLWDAVYETLAAAVTVVIHVGPDPNVVPATFHRLSENVQQQTAGRSLGSYGLRAAARLAHRPWLSAILPSRTALLRAPLIKHVLLEDWLLAHGHHLPA